MHEGQDAEQPGWEALREALGSAGDFELIRVHQTASTNADLLDRARGGAREGLVLVADHQTAGRGRLGRIWQAPPGSSLLVSILLRPRIEIDRLHLITIALGVAATGACRRAGIPAMLKWPNDLVVTDEGHDHGHDHGQGRRASSPQVRKLGGMLAESVVGDGRVAALVVGLGLNVNWPSPLPEDLGTIATSMNHIAGYPLSRPVLLGEILADFGTRYRDLDRAGEGESVFTRGLLGEYRQMSATIGKRVRVDLGHEVVVGDALDVSPEGHLLVIDECPDRPREIVAGDVVHLRGA